MTADPISSRHGSGAQIATCSTKRLIAPKHPLASSFSHPGKWFLDRGSRIAPESARTRYGVIVPLLEAINFGVATATPPHSLNAITPRAPCRLRPHKPSSSVGLCS